MTVTSPWSIVEHRGRAGLLELEADWRRLYAAMPLRTSYHVYEAHLAYVDHLMAAPRNLSSRMRRSSLVFSEQPPLHRFLSRAC